MTILPPIITPQHLMNGLDRHGHLPNLINLNGPSRVPELYDIDLHFDRGHLNYEGALVFSKLFADEFIALLRGEPLQGDRDR